MTTKEATLKAYNDLYPGYLGMIYQFPKGHWGYCVAGSPIAKSLVATGEIYDGVPAQTWELVNFPQTPGGSYNNLVNNQPVRN